MSKSVREGVSISLRDTRSVNPSNYKRNRQLKKHQGRLSPMPPIPRSKSMPSSISPHQQQSDYKQRRKSIVTNFGKGLKLRTNAKTQQPWVFNELEELWLEMDSDADGTINQAEFRAQIKKRGGKLKEAFDERGTATWDQLFKSLDIDEDGRLSKNEFLTAFAAEVGLDRTQSNMPTRAIFDQMDDSSKGFITKEAFEIAMSGNEKKRYKMLFGAVGVPWPEVFQRLDINGDNKISFNEFRSACHCNQNVTKAGKSPDLALAKLSRCPSWKDLEERPDTAWFDSLEKLLIVKKADGTTDELIYPYERTKQDFMRLLLDLVREAMRDKLDEMGKSLDEKTDTIKNMGELLFAHKPRPVVKIRLLMEDKPEADWPDPAVYADVIHEFLIRLRLGKHKIRTKFSSLRALIDDWHSYLGRDPVVDPYVRSLSLFLNYADYEARFLDTVRLGLADGCEVKTGLRTCLDLDTVKRHKSLKSRRKFLKLVANGLAHAYTGAFEGLHGIVGETGQNYLEKIIEDGILTSADAKDPINSFFICRAVATTCEQLLTTCKKQGRADEVMQEWE